MGDSGSAAEYRIQNINSVHIGSCTKNYGISANNADPVVTPHVGLVNSPDFWNDVLVDTTAERVYNWYVYAWIEEGLNTYSR